jgi:hypothetical protein
MADNNHEHKTVTKDGYEVTFHPAFSSRCAVRSNGSDAETELYKQEGKHFFKNGATHPKRHVFRIKGGKHNRDLELEIKDPKHHVARIIVEFYEDGHEPGYGDARMSEPVEVVTFDNSVMTCPPYCDGPPTNTR